MIQPHCSHPLRSGLAHYPGRACHRPHSCPPRAAGIRRATMSAPAGSAADLQRLEEQVDALHKQAQALNKSGRVGEATQVYKQMAALDDQALQLALTQPPTLPTEAALQQHALDHPTAATLHRPSKWDRSTGASSRNSPRKPSNDSSSKSDPGAAVAEAAAVLRSRALGAVVGAAVADAAAMGVHWVYDLGLLETWAAERAAAGGETAGGLEFLEPPRSPFYTYESGRPSPYGEQTWVLLQSLVEAGGLECRLYAQALADAFGADFDGYRDVSTKAFLRRHACGLLPPGTGLVGDRQANAFTRLPPLVALFAGDERLPALVEAAIRVTQNDDVAVAYGQAAASILEWLMLGESSSVTAAVQRTAAALLAQPSLQQAQHAGQQEQQQQQHGGSPAAAAGGAEPAVSGVVPADIAVQVAGALQQAVQLAGVPPPEATAILGRNCHLPTSLVTALQILMHLEAGPRAAPTEGAAEGEAGSARPHQPVQGSAAQQDNAEQQGGAVHLDTTKQKGSAAQLGSQVEQAGDEGPAQKRLKLESGGAADGTNGEDSTLADGSAEAFCLPCSMGGPEGSAACAWQPRQQPATVGGLAGLDGSPAAAAGGAGPSSETYVAAVRAALREGGCCASRASYIGACLGAMAGEGVVPESWGPRLGRWEELQRLAAALCCLRD